jgi:hypothetical protein
LKKDIFELIEMDLVKKKVGFELNKMDLVEKGWI